MFLGHRVLWLLLLSTLQPHRVLISEDESERLNVRRSLVFFVHPDPDVNIICIDGSHKYPPVNSAQYLDDRIQSSYKYGENTS